MHYEEIADTVASAGLLLRGGFHPVPADAVPALDSGRDTGTVLLIGSAGAAGWRAFAASRTPGPDPLQRWTRERVAPLAARLAARAVYPEDRPYLPFQQWARRAEEVHPTPLALLIDPRYGLWHSYRAALLIAGRIAMPNRGAGDSPCETCPDQPCLHACPVEAFHDGRFDGDACHGHLDSAAGGACLQQGCRARAACPVAAEQRYPPDQVRFHMAAFHPGRR